MHLALLLLILAAVLSNSLFARSIEVTNGIHNDNNFLGFLYSGMRIVREANNEKYHDAAFFFVSLRNPPTTPSATKRDPEDLTRANMTLLMIWPPSGPRQLVLKVHLKLQEDPSAQWEWDNPQAPMQIDTKTQKRWRKYRRVYGQDLMALKLSLQEATNDFLSSPKVPRISAELGWHTGTLAKSDSDIESRRGSHLTYTFSNILGRAHVDGVDGTVDYEAGISDHVSS